MVAERGGGTVPERGPARGVDVPVPIVPVGEMPVPQGPPGIIDPGDHAAAQGAFTNRMRDNAQAAFQTGTAGRRTVTGRRSASAPPTEDRDEGDNPCPGTRRRFDQAMGPTRENNTEIKIGNSGNPGTQVPGTSQPEPNGRMRDMSVLLEAMKKMFMGQDQGNKGEPREDKKWVVLDEK
jgi:hypothetical protein